MPGRIRIGIVGTGFGTAIHVPGFGALDEFEVTAICSAREERARSAAEQCQIPYWTTEYRVLLDRRDVDAVAIAAPPFLHHEMVLAAVDAGKHVLCEKPTALNVQQAIEMRDGINASGLTGMIDHEFRWMPARMRAKELIDEGYLGDIRTASVVVNTLWIPESRPFTWWSERSKGGGALGAVGSHYIDTLRWFCGPMTHVSGQLAHFVPRRLIAGTAEWANVTSDDSFAFALRFANGAQGVVQLSMVARGGGMRIEVCGSDGVLLLTAEDRLSGARGREPLEDIEIPARLRPPAELAGKTLQFFAFTQLATAFARGIRNGVSPSPNFEDGMAVQRVMDAIHESDDRGAVATIESGDRRSVP